MALERRNPLPVGIYSVDLPNQLVEEFRRWQQGRSSVKVLKTNDDGEFSWILFSVSAPTIWATGLGFPQIAKATDERPQAFEPEKDPLDKIADAVKTGPISGIYLAGVAGVGIAVYILGKELFNSGKRQIRKRLSSRSGRDKS